MTNGNHSSCRVWLNTSKTYTNVSVTERIEVCVGIKPYYTDDPPRYSISIDDRVLFDSRDIQLSAQLHRHKFTVELDAGTHSINIRFDETEGAQTGVDIVELEINNHSFDETDIYLRGRFVLDQERWVDGTLTKIIKQYKHLGWSGTWSFDFSIPYLFWALRHL